MIYDLMLPEYKVIMSKFYSWEDGDAPLQLHTCFFLFTDESERWIFIRPMIHNTLYLYCLYLEQTAHDFMHLLVINSSNPVPDSSSLLVFVHSSNKGLSLESDTSRLVQRNK